MFSLRQLLSAALLCAGVVSAGAADLRVEARLIWGANGDKDAVKYKPVSPELAQKLHRTFKWTNYFEITNRTASIPLNQVSELKMSGACTIRVKNIGSSRVEINCIGLGKQLHKGAYNLVPPQWLVLGGKDSDNTAWFIGLKALDGKTAQDLRSALGKN